jgi:predicted GNAT superfamily acetyltransferase
MQTTDFRFPGVLNSKELLVAEAVQARAWAVLSGKGRFRDDDEVARARLGGIVVRLMADGSQSVGDLASAAIDSFERAAS